MQHIAAAHDMAICMQLLLCRRRQCPYTHALLLQRAVRERAGARVVVVVAADAAQRCPCSSFISLNARVAAAPASEAQRARGRTFCSREQLPIIK